MHGLVRLAGLDWLLALVLLSASGWIFWASYRLHHALRGNGNSISRFLVLLLAYTAYRTFATAIAVMQSLVNHIDMPMFSYLNHWGSSLFLIALMLWFGRIMGR